MTKEQKFHEALKDIFVGAIVEGESGYINLMRIKSRYYEKGVFPKLQNDIEEALKPFPEFREEFFDKLYTFFNRYFSESGSIYFRYTPIHQNVYERVYTDDKDVILFWKTHMLYYVKTDRLFKNLEVETGGFKFFFDVSHLEHKRANEKRQIVYEFKEKRNDGGHVFSVYYSEKGKKTKTDEILKALAKIGVRINEDILENAFRVFEKQSEVDYFINKNAQEFLKEQFNIWLYQYVFSGESEWTEKRIKQLQTLKDTAFKIIDFISQFEDELVRIWNKPKFVLDSNYVITLDRLFTPNCRCEEQSDEAIPDQKGIELIEKIITHKNFEAQVKEWQDLGIVDDDFKPSVIASEAKQSHKLNGKYSHLPIDTKYFKDLELEILGLFDDLDNALDGWLIKSENYQALNTILPKFKQKVQTIYIDPPFNKEQDADYFYSVKYKDASWITLLENRLQLVKDILRDTGSIFVRCDYNGNMFVRLLMNEIFGEESFRNEILINRKRQAIGTPNKFEIESEFLFLFGKSQKVIKKDIYKMRNLINMKWTSFLKQEERKPAERIFFGKVLYPPKEQHFSLIQEKVDQLLKENYLRLKCSECRALYYWDNENPRDKIFNKIVLAGKNKFKYFDIVPDDKVYGVTKIDKCLNCGKNSWKVEYLTSEKSKLGDNWKDITSYEDNWRFKTENSEILLKRVIESTSNEGDLVFDYFLGSGTTTAVAHKLKRKWLGVEMGEHFYTVVLPRVKKVLAGDQSGISKEVKWQGGGFFKYYELEQYEDTLRKVNYEDSDFFENPYQDPYHQYMFMRDLKMLEALEIDYENNKVKVELSKLYKSIDIPETLSNLLGKWIKRITADYMEFENGEKINIKDLDYKLIKPLIWW